MQERRTELHDDLRALLAAGRELSPDHDEALADIFLDRLDRTVAQPPTHHTRLPRAVRHRVGAALLALVLLTGGGLVSAQWSARQGQSVEVQPSGIKVPAVKVVPGVPKGKVFVAPAKPAPKDAPLQPKG